MHSSNMLRWFAILGCVGLLGAFMGYLLPHPLVSPHTSLQATTDSTNGCLIQGNPTPSASTTDLIITDTRDSGHTITLPVGHTLQIQLRSDAKWDLAHDERATLNLSVIHFTTPFSAYDASAHACIWRFIAVHTGTTQILFYGSPLNGTYIFLFALFNIIIA